MRDGAFIFDEKLYFNYAQSFNDSDITMDEFERAAKPLCDQIEDDNNDSKSGAYYYGGWVRVSINMLSFTYTFSYT